MALHRRILALEEAAEVLPQRILALVVVGEAELLRSSTLEDLVAEEGGAGLRTRAWEVREVHWCR